MNLEPFVVLAFAASLAYALPARADGAPVVTYTAPPRCPSAASFLATLHSLPPTRRDAAPVRSVRVRLDEDGARFRGELQVEEHDGVISTRVIAGAACDELAETLLFLAALAMGLSVAEPPKLAPSGPEATPPPVRTSAPPVRTSAPPRTKPPPPRSPWGLFAGVSLTALPMIGPSLRGALEPFVAVEFGRARFVAPELRVSLTHATSGTLDGSVGLATLRLDAATLEACPVRLAVTGGMRVRPCLAFQAGVIEGRGYGAGLIDPHAEDRPWLSLAFPLRAEWLVASVIELGAQVTPLVPLLVHRFYFGPDTPVYELPAVGLSAGVSLAVRFR